MPSLSAADQHRPTRLAENFRASRPVPDQVFRVVTSSDTGHTHLDDEHTGTFGGVIRHALVCARSIRSRFDLHEATCDVTDRNGSLIYSVSAIKGRRGMRTRRTAEAS